MMKSFPIAFVLLVGIAIAPSYALGQRPIELKSFSHPLSRGGIVKLLGTPPLLDSLFEREGQNIDHKILIFAPVHVKAFRAIARVRLAGDSVDRIEFVLPYREHPNVKPNEPYAEHGFVNASVDDLTALRERITKEFGEPSIMSETFFEYLPSPGVPAMRAQFRDRSVFLLVSVKGVL